MQEGDGRPSANDLRSAAWSCLMEQIQDGNEAAYRVLLEELGPLVYNYTRKRVFRADFVEDVYQEIWMTFHRARHSYEPGRPFGPWFFTVVRHALIDALGRQRKFQEKELFFEVLPDRALEREDHGLEDEWREALQHLSPAYRDAVRLLKLEGLSLEEAAGKLGLSVGALKVRAHRGYAKMREFLLKQNFKGKKRETKK